MGGFVSRIQALALALGAPGLFLVALLDSTFVPLPELNDLLLIWMVTRHKSLMLLYAASAMLGSLAGCLLLYGIGRKGGEPLVRRRFASGRVDSVLGTLQRYGGVSVLIACLLPPPAPFKLFVLLAGAAGISVGRFALAVAIGRSLRFLVLGFLAIRFGDRALELLHANGPAVSVAVVSLMAAALAGYLLWQRAQRAKAR